jgi:hypothetical protein
VIPGTQTTAAYLLPWSARVADDSDEGPSHLEAVTQRVNNQRAGAAKTTCLRDHRFTLENTYINPRGHRICRQCRVLRDHRLGDIGDNPKEIEYEPLSPAVPLPITIPAPAEPVRVPEEVPA